jgi:predicted permease
MNSRHRSPFGRLFKRSTPTGDAPDAGHSGGLPGGQLFPVVAILCIAVVVGLNTALFTNFNGRVLRPRPVADPASLYEVEGLDAKDREIGLYSYQEYVALRDQNQVFQHLTADYSLNLNTPDGDLNSALVSGNYFDALGIRPMLGRAIQPDDDRPGAPPVVVLGHGLWRERYGADPQVVGRQIELAARSFTVVGVTANDVEGLDPAPTAVWVPLSTRGLFTGPDYMTSSADLWLRLVGRLKPGVSGEQATASLNAIIPEITRPRPQPLILAHVLLESFATYGILEDFPWLLMSPIIFAFGLVLLIACGSIAMVQLARMLAGRREISERLARGVGRARLVGELVTGSLPLVAVGGALGLAFSHAFIVLLRKFILDPETAASRVFAVTVDFRIIGYVILLTITVGVIVGLLPAMRATRLGAVSNMKGDGGRLGRRMRKGRLHHGFVIAQCALVLLLLSLAGSLVRHQVKLSSTPLGFDTDQRLFVELRSGPTRREFWDKLKGIPGVVSVSNQLVEPLYNESSVPVSLTPPAAGRYRTGFNTVSPEYFETLGLPLVAGRAFTTEEAGAKANVAIVSQATAQRLWPGQDALGQQLTVQFRVPRTLQVVGVVKGIVNQIPMDGADANFVYLPLNPGEPTDRFLARVDGDLAGTQRAIRAAMSTAYPIADFEMYPLSEWMNWASYTYKVSSWVGAGLGVFCLLLACMGIYGAMAQLVALRQPDGDARRQAGGQSDKLSRLVVLASFRLSAIAIVIGLIITVAIWYVLPEPVLKRNLIDPLVLIVAIGSLLGVAIVAAFLTTRDSAPGDPGTTARREPVQPPAGEMAFKFGAGGED